MNKKTIIFKCDYRHHDHKTTFDLRDAAQERNSVGYLSQFKFSDEYNDEYDYVVDTILSYGAIRTYICFEI